LESRLHNAQHRSRKSVPLKIAGQKRGLLKHDNLEQFDAPSTNTATLAGEPQSPELTVQKLLADFPNNPYARAAAKLVPMGIPVVHLLPGEKISHAKIGAATLDLNTIYSRAKSNDFNAGSYAYEDGDLSLFDVDGLAAKKRIEEETGHSLDELDVFTVATPNGGWHYYFIKDAELGALGNVKTLTEPTWVSNYDKTINMWSRHSAHLQMAGRGQSSKTARKARCRRGCGCGYRTSGRNRRHRKPRSPQRSQRPRQ